MTEYDDWLHAQEDAAWDADMEDETPPFPSEPPEWWWEMDEARDALGRTSDEAYDAWRDERMEDE